MTQILNPGVYRNHLINGELFAYVIVSRHENAYAMTAIHTDEFERTIGGTRFVTSGDLAEVGHLAQAMTEKCMAANIPAGGQKSVIITQRKVIDSLELRVEILTEHIRIVKKHFPGVIFGPDMNTPEAVQNSLAEDVELRDFVTGLSESHEGLSIDKNGYTAFGLREAIRTWQETKKQELRTVAIQGFGAVGAHTARFLSEDGLQIRAVSNELGVLDSRDQSNLPIAKLFLAWQEGGDEAVIKFAKLEEEFISLHENPNHLFKLPVDIFVPAARTSCLGVSKELSELREENPDVEDVLDFAGTTGVRLIVEGANHPISESGEFELEKMNVAVLPDFIVNCGGLIGCWMEWQSRHSNKTLSKGISAHAREHIRTTIRENISRIARAEEPSRIAAARIVADRSESLKRR